MPVQHLLIVEIKPPHKVRMGSRPDFIKLAIEMKEYMDKMITDGLGGPKITVLGLLIEGFRCTLFVMDLKYQGIYRLIRYQSFIFHEIIMILASSQIASRRCVHAVYALKMTICASSSFATRKENLIAATTSLSHARPEEIQEEKVL